jgi:hypothetical protein
LPTESLRFFYIDDFWLDCLLDGALSVANHLDSDDDAVRREIKRKFNEYLRHEVTGTGGRKPQIPCYGFIIRSKLIKAMPDLRITVTWDQPDPKRASVCRWTRWDDQTLMALLDRQPQELMNIRLSQPQHQKRFSFGAQIDTDFHTGAQPTQPPTFNFTFPMRKLYTEHLPPDDEEWVVVPLPSSDVSGWINTTTRVLEVDKMAHEMNAKLQRTGEYTDDVANSIELGFELNDNCYYFDIVPHASSTTTIPPRDRQLYVSQNPPLRPIQPMAAPLPARTPPKLMSARPKSLPQTAKATKPLPRAPHGELRIQPRPPNAQIKKPSPASTRSTDTATTLQTRFDLVIFADYKGPPTRFPQEKYHKNDYLATNNIYFYDLIFSIRKKPIAAASQYQLLKIVIDLPVATNPPNTLTEALLSSNYDGQGVRMLSNQRFVPFLFNDDPGEPLHVELVPRSANDDYSIMLNDRKTREVGFRLAEANVSPVVVETLVQIEGEQRRQKRGKVLITMTEWYSTPAFPRGEAVESKYALIKWATRDDEDLG